ncbi:MAG TPA: TonB-dependent receptor plug domain-containing protein, partial [Bryobacteraceae bacterium]|nr:TonB-dependent receptor plug domain-containing protein [Bryobacteraceae bacterium]
NPTGRNEIKIRGMGGDYTLLLVNGKRVNARETLGSSFGNDFDLSSIPMAAIERIEVIRGPVSSLYGADALGGVVNVMPKFAALLMLFGMANAGLPGTSGFIGEFTILQGAFEANRAWAAIAVTGIIFGAAYLLWMYQRTMLGQITNPKNLRLPDLSFRELATFLPLIAWAIWIGVYPQPHFAVLEKPVAQIVERVRPDYFQKPVQQAEAPRAAEVAR